VSLRLSSFGGAQSSALELLLEFGIQKAVIDHCHEDAPSFASRREKGRYWGLDSSGVSPASSIGYAVGRWLAEGKVWGTSRAR
jgi:hypothetical protein